MNQKPLVSVIVLVYNAEKYIAQTLRSILEQKTRYPFEIIVCDDASKDRSVSLVNELQKKHEQIRLYVNAENLGIISNYKQAIDLSAGKYVAYCGHDDYWHDPEKLEKQVSFLEANPAYGLIHSDYDIYHDDTGKTTFNKHKTYPGIISQGAVSNDLIHHYNICGCTVCFRKEVFERYVPIQDFIKYKFPVEDWATYVTIAIHSEVGYMECSTATYRIGHTSESNPSDFSRLESYLNQHEVMFTYLKNKFPDKFSRFGPDDYTIYKNVNLLKAAYRFSNYPKAHAYARVLQDLNQKDRRSVFASNRITFYSYAMLYKVGKWLRMRFVVL